jgi:hypothetical protein
MSVSRVLGLMAVSVWLAASCSSAKKIDVGATCILNSDCGGSLVCTSGLCHVACHTTADCLAGQSCVKTSDSTICQLPADVPCSATSSCKSDLLCAPDQHCRTGCLSAANCTPGQLCASNFCADPNDPDLVNGQIVGSTNDAGTDLLSADVGSSSNGADVLLAPADAGSGGADLAVGPTDAPIGTGADVADTGPDVSADVAPSKLPDARADLVAQVDLPADLPVDKLTSTGPDVNSSTADAVIGPDGGGESPVPTGCGVAPTSTRYFCDDFESGLSNWVVSGQDWGLTTEQARSMGHSATDTPGGQITTGENAAITMATSLDLTGAVAPVLVFWDKRAAGYSHTYVEASSDGGTTWSQLADWWGDADHSTWLMQQLSLSSFVGKKVKIRFRLAQYASYTGDGWYIDDVEIRENWPVDSTGAGAKGCDAMPAAVSPRYFCDDFETGISKWIVSGYDWNTTVIEARSGGASITDTPEGSIVSGENAAITMATSLDLTGAVTPVLVFWDKRAAGYNDTYVEASSDGGTTWSQLAYWGNGDHSTWLMQQLSLSSFVGKKVKIRFRLAQWASYTGDGWYIDDVEIREPN